ncbi:MAG: hypothetical protein O9325_10755 [Roseomonas sp.]|nr:hypothetical protein [Roseomonas sp.]
MKLPRILLAAAFFAPGLAAAQPAVVTASAERSAIVDRVNAQERAVLLRGQAGTLATLILGPQVRNFAQIRPGDRVVTTMTDAIAVSLARPDGRGPVGSAEALVRAPEGARPGDGYTDAQRMRVRIEGIDLGRNSVAYVDPAGTRREVRVQTPEMRRFMRTLRPGDEVDVIFIESISVRVVPPGG